MKNRVVLKTNIMISLIIATGFLLISAIYYRISYNVALEHIEQVSDLTSENIYQQILVILDKPVDVSAIMANNTLLRGFLLQESDRLSREEHTETLQKYLQGYQSAYGYNEVFLVSFQTGHFHSYDGEDQFLSQEDLKKKLYFQDLSNTDKDYIMYVESDESAEAGNRTTLYVISKIPDSDGTLLGVVGIGVPVDQFQTLIQEYNKEFGVNVSLLDSEGIIQISSDYMRHEKVNVLEASGRNGSIWQSVLDWEEDGAGGFWELGTTGQKQTYMVVRYLPDIEWHLVVEQNMDDLLSGLRSQMAVIMAVFFIILLLVLIVVIGTVQSFDRQIVAITAAHEQERQAIFIKATNQLFEDIYEVDITNNRPANLASEAYFARMGVPEGMSFGESLPIIAKKRFREEFRQGYLDAFSPENVLKAFQNGEGSIRYECMATNDEKNYYWIRVIGELIVSEKDGTLHMLVYRENIEKEKQQEYRLLTKSLTDEMTGVRNKAAFQEVSAKLDDDINEGKAVFGVAMFDINYLKWVNDNYGHDAGDQLIIGACRFICSIFKRSPVYRIGGDEFSAILMGEDLEAYPALLEEFRAVIERKEGEEHPETKVSVAQGIAVYDSTRDRCFTDVFRRADEAMYGNKAEMKARHRELGLGYMNVR